MFGYLKYNRKDPDNTLLFGCKLKEEGNSNEDICNVVKMKSMWRDNDIFKEYHSCQRGLNSMERGHGSK